MAAHLRDTDVVKTVVEHKTQGAGTRERVRDLLLALGPSTAAVLGDRLGLSPAAVRKHLDALLLDGAVTTREQRPRGARGRGRPARLYVLTDAGHADGPSGYDDLATAALRFLEQAGGEEAVERFAQARGAELEGRYAERLRELTPDARPAALAEALTADGYAASTSEQGLGLQLCQHHCPVQHVAAEFPQLCDAETAALGRLLDVHVQRLATISHGDGVCTTFIPATAKATR
ncbi:MAG: transcriptional regulator, ArsR family [Frankiales bacterium]|nr:transcriptional regulator, ArsR family [Frankiales bacterium]